VNATVSISSVFRYYIPFACIDPSFGPTVRGALTAMDEAIQQMRDRNMLVGLPFDAPLRVLDLVEHYHATADALEECGQLLCTLKIQRYWGDCGL
jgi:hypothetical protein